MFIDGIYPLRINLLLTIPRSHRLGALYRYVSSTHQNLLEASRSLLYSAKIPQVARICGSTRLLPIPSRATATHQERDVKSLPRPPNPPRYTSFHDGPERRTVQPARVVPAAPVPWIRREFYSFPPKVAENPPFVSKMFASVARFSETWLQPSRGFNL